MKDLANSVAYTFDIATQTPVAYIKKEDIEYRQRLFSKTAKEKAALATIKAAHNRTAKGKINSPAVSRKLGEQLMEYFNHRLKFNLTKFNGQPLI